VGKPEGSAGLAMSGYHSIHATRRDDGGGAVCYGLPITADDFDRLLKGHQSMILTLRRSPTSLSIALVPARVRYLPAGYEVREVPLLIGPEAAR